MTANSRGKNKGIKRHALHLYNYWDSIINDLKPDKRIIAVPVSFGVAF